MSRRFQAQAVFAGLASLVSQADFADTLVRPFGEVLHIAQHNGFQHFLFQAECFESFCFVERQWTMDISRTDNISLQFLVYLRVEQDCRSTKQTG